jgi:hypothetical protein
MLDNHAEVVCAIYLLVHADLISVFRLQLRACGSLRIRELKVLKTLLDLFVCICEGIGMILKYYATA